jgi:uncharacterized protein
MDFLIYSRASSSVTEDREPDEEQLTEQHWTYMDGYADAMTARGPLLGPDRDSWEGSLHIVDLPGPDAVRAFVADEPYQRAGLFGRHSIWRYVDLLGRTMWQFPDDADEPRFLVIARGRPGAPGTAVPVPLDDLPVELRRRLIVYGELRGLDDDVPAGVALAVQAPTRAFLDDLLDDEGAGLGGLDEVDVHDWEFGGRR